MGDVDIQETTWEGKPMISLQWMDSDKYPFNFGVGKARLLKAALEADPSFLDEFLVKNSRGR